MRIYETKKLELSRKLMDEFARRTGLTGNEGDIEQRYLWTDAFAVQTFFALAHTLGENSYRELALKLINTVHLKLGRYHWLDTRKGWISGLSEEEGQKNPTAGGLRIGKKLPERKAGEPLNERLEWDRDGQYFHYITRWFYALLAAGQETQEKRYVDWAAKLIEASDKFIYRSGGRLRMYWKMSVDLSRPLVASMGAHDPLEGLLCANSAQEAISQKSSGLETLIQSFQEICTGQDWFTTDSLGIGGLLLNIPRAVSLSAASNTLPDEVKPAKLLADSLAGLQVYRSMQEISRPAHQRLAFRECGLSLGLRVVSGLKKQLISNGLETKALNNYISLADAIEDFWSKPVNQRVSTWQDHWAINVVSLAASLIAHHYPFTFGAGR